MDQWFLTPADRGRFPVPGPCNLWQAFLVHTRHALLVAGKNSKMSRHLTNCTVSGAFLRLDTQTIAAFLPLDMQAINTSRTKASKPWKVSSQPLSNPETTSSYTSIPFQFPPHTMIQQSLSQLFNTNIQPKLSNPSTDSKCCHLQYPNFPRSEKFSTTTYKYARRHAKSVQNRRIYKHKLQ